MKLLASLKFNRPRLPRHIEKYLVLFQFFLYYTFFTSSFGLLLENGKCQTRCLIPLDIDLKCGSNGLTYQNNEELDCAQRLCFPDLTVAYDGKCRDGQQEHLNVPNKGTNELEKSQPSSTSPQSVILFKSDIPPNYQRQQNNVGISFSKKRPNRPRLTSNHIISSSNKAKNCNPDECVCDYVLSPICASNGHTYGNLCILQCVQECEPELTYHHSGFCGKIFFPNGQIPFFRVWKPQSQ